MYRIATTTILLASFTIFAKAQVSGTVYRDYNSNGIREISDLLTEPLLQGVTVRAFNSAGNQVGSTATTNVNGDYSIVVPAGTAVRVEFSGFSAGLFAGNAGDQSGTTLQFVTAPSDIVNLGLTSLADYNLYGLQLLTGCYVNGDPVVAGSESGPLPAIVGINYYTKEKKYGSTNSQIGGTWGLAFAKAKKRLYSAAVVRRHVGFGPNGIGAIYKSNPYNPASTTNLFYNFGAAAGTVSSRDLTASLATPTHDTEAFGKVAKAGIGDIDISTDENTLYVVNLFDRKLYKIAIDASGAASGVAIEVTGAPWITAPNCTNGVARPWACKVASTSTGDKVYVGGVCDASTGTPTVDNLSAWVYEYNVATSTWTSTPSISFPLNYPRQNPGGNNPYGTTFKWKPWTDSYTTMRSAYNSTTQVGGYDEADAAGGGNYAMPVFSDIEFDDNGDMILGFLDRGGLQFGAGNYPPDPALTNLISYVSGGDILRAGKNANGTWTIENNGITNGIGGTRTTSSTNPQNAFGNLVDGGGPGGREFYWGEHFGYTGFMHWETSFGGLAFVPGKGEVLISALDPDSTFNSGGILWLDNMNGEYIDGTNLYESTSSNNGFFAKAIGITDLEPIPSPPLNEIGNRIWADNDNDGIQDAGEVGIAGLTVQLFQTNVLIASTTTDADGQYYFNANNVTGGILNNTAYEIRVATNQSAIATSALSPKNIGNLELDSDASLVSGMAVVTHTTPAVDAINHSLDIGFYTICAQLSVALGTDDGYELTSGVIGDRLTRNFGVIGGVYGSGLRFQNLAIPFGATITSAKVVFTGNTNQGGVSEGTGDNLPVNLLISADAAVNPSTYVNVDFGISSRMQGAVSIPWNLNSDAWVSGYQDANTITPELNMIVQEVVNHSGWASGNSIALTFKTDTGTGGRRWETFEGNAALSPKLIVCYEPPCTPPTAFNSTQTPPTCNGGSGNNNGKITVTAISSADKFGVSAGNTYTGSTYTTATILPSLPFDAQSMIPNTGGTYTIRFFNGSNDCFIDQMITVAAVTCTACPVTNYQLCPNETYTLTTGAGLTNIQWLRNGTIIQGATMMNYVATQIGTYTYTADQTASGCSGTLCCPVEIIAGTNCCTISAAMPIVTCHDANTGSTPSDDYYTVTLNPSGQGIGTTYNVGGGITANNIPYGAAQQIGGNLLISNGNITITITDNTSGATCQLSNIVIMAPAPCSIPVDRPTSVPPGYVAPCHIIDVNLRLGLMNVVDDTLQMVADDGLTVVPTIATPGTTLNLEMEVYNNKGGNAYLVGWIDWNGNGILDTATEQIISQTIAAQGTTFVPVTVMIPANVPQNVDIVSAFRLSTQSGLGPYGEICAPDGEYENYMFRFSCPAPLCLPMTVSKN